jgi:carboxymethylenebutenolidase
MNVRTTLAMTVCAALSAAPLFAQATEPAAPQAAQQAPAPQNPASAAPQNIEVPWNDALPPGTADHAARALKESTRHQEWVKIKMADGTDLNAFVVYPERPTKAGAVIVIHDIRGMADIPKAAGDQLAQDGYIAIVPDFLSGKGPNGGGTESLGAGVGQAIQSITNEDFDARFSAAVKYARSIPSANGKVASLGFCWGGTKSWLAAIQQPTLSAAVVFYGDVPTFAQGAAAYEPLLAKVKAPVLGLYGGSDARIGATIPGTTESMKKLGKPYDPHSFEGAGHGFMGSQAGMGGANLKAAQQAWPMVLKFLGDNLK